MTFDVRAISAALGDAVTGAGDLDGYGWVPSKLAGLSVFVGRVVYDYNQTFGGQVKATMTLHAAAPLGEFQQAQEDLQDLLAPTGVKAVIETDRTLGGLVQTLNVPSGEGPGLIDVGGQSYWGASWTVEVWS